MTDREKPQSYDEHIDTLRQEIDQLDAAIIASIRRRTEVSRTIGKLRTEAGGERIVAEREQKIHDHYDELGSVGHTVADAVLELGRGPIERE